MLKIKAKCGHRRPEIIERVDNAAEADFLASEYQLVFGNNFKVTVEATRAEQTLSEMRRLREEGLTHGQIADRLNVTRGYVDQIMGSLARKGEIEYRRPGMPPQPLTERDLRVLELHRAGLRETGIAKELGITYVAAKMILAKLRKRGVILKVNES